MSKVFVQLEKQVFSTICSKYFTHLNLALSQIQPDKKQTAGSTLLIFRSFRLAHFPTKTYIYAHEHQCSIIDQSVRQAKGC